MCGIVGLASTTGKSFFQEKQNWLRKSLYVDTLRGADSTGIACIPPSPKEIIIYKKALPGYDFIELSYVKDLLFDVDDFNYIIGHNRSATMGAVNAAGAHPFQHGNITLVHNGTLESFAGLNTKFIIDSEAICSAIAEQPAKKVLEQLHGAYALVWYDSSDKTLHMARNDERPLHFAVSEDGKNMVFASEAWMIDNLTHKNLKLEETLQLLPGRHITFSTVKPSFKEYDVEVFTPYVAPKVTRNIGTWPHNGGGNYHAMAEDLAVSLGYELYTVTEFTVTKVTPYSSKTHCSVKGTCNTCDGQVEDEAITYNYKIPAGGIQVGDILEGYVKGATRKGTGTYNYIIEFTEVTTKGEHLNSIIEDDLDNIINIDKNGIGSTNKALFEGPNNTKCTKRRFNKLTKEGCAYCSTNIFPGDHRDIMWTQDNKPLCPSCSEQFYATN